MAKITQDELNKLLWNAADSTRGTVDGGMFKDYILAFLFYKLLLNNSPTYANYKVERAHILFVRPDNDGEVYDKVYDFDPEMEKELVAIMQAVYYQIVDLKFLDDKEIFVPANKELKLKDIKDFIALLLAKNPK